MTFSRLILLGLLVAIAGTFGLYSGLIRPPRPMFHDCYAAGSFGLVPTWQPGPAFCDRHGQWAWMDMVDNLVVVHATGTAERGRSHAMTAGTKAARFRLGSAWNDEQDNSFVSIPRMNNALVVILPDGRWKSLPLAPGQAIALWKAQDGSRVPQDLLANAGGLLSEDARFSLEGYLQGYLPPEPANDDD